MVESVAVATLLKPASDTLGLVGRRRVAVVIIVIE
jgi:hypothetical protein